MISSWLHLLKSWSLRKIRGGSLQGWSNTASQYYDRAGSALNNFGSQLDASGTVDQFGRKLAYDFVQNNPSRAGDLSAQGWLSRQLAPYAQKYDGSSANGMVAGAMVFGANMISPSDPGRKLDRMESAVDAAKPFALGLGEHLDDFAKARGAMTYKDLADPSNWRHGVLDALADPNRQVHFNLDGVDLWRGIQRASSGRGGATDWELLQVKQNPQFWDSLQFWESGQPVPNPFK